MTLPGPDEDHNPETRASLAAVMGGRPDIPAEQRAEVARFIEDLTVSHQAGWYSVISLHGGGSPEAMKREIWRNYPVMEKADLVEKAGRTLFVPALVTMFSAGPAVQPNSAENAFVSTATS